MFSNLFFLILVLLVVNLAPEAQFDYWNATPAVALFQGLSLYGATLFLIYLQNRIAGKIRRLTTAKMLHLANLELIACLLVYHFLFAAHRLYSPAGWALSHTILAVVSLFLYFVGLGWFHYTDHDQKVGITKKASSSYQHTTRQLRFLLPFSLPFVLFSFLADILEAIPNVHFQNMLTVLAESSWGTALLVVATLAFMGLVMVFLPPIIQRIWRCEPLPDGEFKQRLESLCQRAHFKHAGIKTWTVMNHSLTAAIIGVIPRFRYVMFTQSLLTRLSPEEIEAILAHEIGHSYRRHLLLYPFVIFGMIISAGLFFLFFAPTIHDFLALNNLQTPSPFWGAVYPLAILVPYALIIAIYFRVVFGFFSRNFERQADLHAFHLNVPAEDMVSALDSVAIFTGNTHRHPSWHHYSIQQRINFLRACQHQPSLIARHHRRVRRIFSGYLVVMTLAATVLASPMLREAPVVGYVTAPIADVIEDASVGLNSVINRPLRYTIAKELVDRYALKGDQALLVPAIEASLEDFAAAQLPGIAEFYSAQRLLVVEELSASAVMMAKAWETFDFDAAHDSVIDDFDAVTDRILEALKPSSHFVDERQGLLDAQEAAKTIPPGT